MFIISRSWKVKIKYLAQVKENREISTTRSRPPSVVDSPFPEICSYVTVLLLSLGLRSWDGKVQNETYLKLISEDTVYYKTNQWLKKSNDDKFRN